MSPFIEHEETHGEYVEQITRAGHAGLVRDGVIAFVRTAVPALVGSFLAWLISLLPLVGAIITWIDMQIATAGLDGISFGSLLGLLAAAGVIIAYYAIARQLGKRWPHIETFLLGSSRTPIYTAPAA